MNRSEFIGGSDLSAIIFGEDRWGVTKYQLFLEKTGIVREINKEKELEEVDKLIKCYIGENQTLMFKGAIIATWNEQETTRLMQKEIQKDHPDLCSNYLKTTGTRVLRIK